MAKSGGKGDAPKGPATVNNRRARYDYEILDTYEAGLVLVGSEAKSCFLGRVNLTDAYAQVKDGEMWVMELDIEPYTHTSSYIPERRRTRKLLLHRKEIETIERRSQEKGFAVIPLRLYFKNGRAKLEIGLGRGKREYDKREAIQAKDSRREREEVRRLR